MRTGILKIATLAIAHICTALPPATDDFNVTSTLERRYDWDPQRHSIHLSGEHEAAIYIAANGFGIVLPYRFYIEPSTPSDKGFNPWRQNSVTVWYYGLLACQEKFGEIFSGMEWFDDSLLEWYIRPVHAKLGETDTLLVRIDAMYNKNKEIERHRKIDFKFRFEWVWNDPYMQNRLRTSIYQTEHINDLEAVGQVAGEAGEGLPLDILGALSYVRNTHKILPGLKVEVKTEEDWTKDESVVKEEKAEESVVKEEKSDDVDIKPEETDEPVNLLAPVHRDYRDDVDDALATAKKLFPELDRFLTWDRPESEAHEDNEDGDEDDEDEDDEDEDDEDEDDEDEDEEDEEYNEAKIKRPPSDDSLQGHNKKRPNSKGGWRRWL